MAKWSLPWLPKRLHADWYTVSELARALGVNENTAYRYVKGGVFLSVRINNRLMIKREWYEEVMSVKATPARKS